MNDIMQNDEKVNELSEIEVKDAYVRMKLMKTMMNYYGKYQSGFSHTGFKDAENVLNNESREGVRVWVIEEARKGVLTSNAKMIAKKNRTEDFIIEFFDYISNDDFSDDNKVEMARGLLKKRLHGSLGMPDDSVVRQYIQNC